MIFRPTKRAALDKLERGARRAINYNQPYSPAIALGLAETIRAEEEQALQDARAAAWRQGHEAALRGNTISTNPYTR